MKQNYLRYTLIPKIVFKNDLGPIQKTNVKRGAGY
jgi:hypothetical protein